MAAEAIALVVVGSGEVTEAEVNDLLDDAYGGVEELGLAVPVDKDLYTDAVKAAVDWYNNDKDVFTVATKGATVARGTKNLGDPDEADEVDKLVDYLSPDVFEGWDEVHVLIAMPEDSEETAEEYDFYAEVADAAQQAGFKVMDLTAGLDDIEVKDPEDEEPEEEPEPEPEPVKEEPPKRTRTRKKAAEPEPEKSDMEAVVEALEEIPGVKVEAMPDVVSLLERVLSLESRLETVEDILVRVTMALTAEQPAPKAEEPKEPAPVKEEPKASSRGRGRPRTRFEVKQVWDEDDEEWVARPAGRLSKGTKWRTVHAETGETLDEGTA